MRYLSKRSWIAAFSALCLGLFVPATACAQDYPTKPIKMIVSFPPGNSADLIARAVSERLAQRLGQAVVVENRGGAGGIIGVEQVVHSPPDGYTVGIISVSPISIIPAVNKKLRYDAMRDLQPVTLLAVGPMVLLATNSFAPNNVAELVAYAKANPGKLSYGSLGPGTISQMTMEMFKQATGANIVEITYKGSSQALVDLIAGHLHLLFDGAGSAVPQVKGGKVKAIASSRPKRAPSLPDVPTLDESGIPGLKGFDTAGWIGAFAPAGTPPAIMQRLNAELAQVLTLEDVRTRIAAGGLDVAPANSPEQFREYIHNDFAKWSKVAREAQIVMPQ